MVRNILQAAASIVALATAVPSTAFEVSDTCIAPPTDALFAGTGSVLGASYLKVTDTPCVRIYHKHGHVGCATSQGTAYKARLRGILNDADLDAFLARPTSTKKETLVIPWSMFNGSVVSLLEGTGRVAGAIVLRGSEVWELEETAASFSPQVPPTTPSSPASATGRADVIAINASAKGAAASAADPRHEFNPTGSGALLRSFPFPVTSIPLEGEGKGVLDRARSNDAMGDDAYPRYVSQMCYYMGPEEMDAVKGMPIGGATPVGGLSVFASIGAPLDGGGAAVPGAVGNASTISSADNETAVNGFRSGTLPARPAVVVAVPMDSAAVFAQEAQGAISAIGSVVASLAAAEAVANALHDAGPDGASLASLLPRQIVFALLQAESWAAVGSRRLLFDAIGSEASNARCSPEYLRHWDSSLSSPSSSSPENADPRATYCVRPLMPSLAFERLGAALGVDASGNGKENKGATRVIAMDQVGRLAAGATGGTLKAFVHATAREAAQAGGVVGDPVVAKIVAAAAGVDGIEVAVGSAPEAPASPADAFYLARSLNESSPSAYPFLHVSIDVPIVHSTNAKHVTPLRPTPISIYFHLLSAWQGRETAAAPCSLGTTGLSFPLTSTPRQTAR